MMTEWGLHGADFPLMRAETTWEQEEGSEYPCKRINEEIKYWLCVPEEDKEDA